MNVKVKESIDKLAKMLEVKRTVARTLEDVCKQRRRIRVVVLGSVGSGKTVFLTSLALHLKHHDINAKNVFDLKGWEAFWADDMIKGVSSEIPEFPFERYKSMMVNKDSPKFPNKTYTEISVLRMPIDFKKEGKTRSVLLELMDLPGERVCDLGMANKSYREWCEWLQRAFAGENSDSYKEYCDCSCRAQDRDELFAFYKKHLLREYAKYSFWITPSLVRMPLNSSSNDFEGCKEGETPEERFKKILDKNFLGLNAESQFVPLPCEAFAPEHHLHQFVEAFESAYEQYKKAVVVPIRDWLREADQLVYLVDVLGILRKGVSAYNAEAVFGSDIIGMFKRPQTRLVAVGRLYDYLRGLFKTQIKKAFLVATKADIVRDIDAATRMTYLAKEMFGKNLRDLGLDWKNIETVACAAVKTVRKTENGDTVARVRMPDKSVKRVEYNQPKLEHMEHWPSGSEWPKVSFADTFPYFCERVGSESMQPQIGLDRLVGLMLDDILV